MRAQSSLEFIAIVTIILIVVALAFTHYYAKQSEFDSLVSFSEASSICDRVANTISNTYLAGNGASTSLQLPLTLENGASYYVLIFSNSSLIKVNYASLFVSCRMITTSVSNGTSGNFTLPYSFNALNVNGEVIVS